MKSLVGVQVHSKNEHSHKVSQALRPKRAFSISMLFLSAVGL